MNLELERSWHERSTSRSARSGATPSSTPRRQRIQSQGYERMSIQDVLDDVGASRGAFYHYFDSKQALLEAVIERMGDAAIAGSLGAPRGRPGLDRAGEARASSSPSIAATRPTGSTWSWPSSRSGCPTTTRSSGRSSGAYVVTRMTPLLATIIGQGARGRVDVRRPTPRTRRASSCRSSSASTSSPGSLFMAHQAGTASIESIVATFGAYTRGARADPRPRRRPLSTSSTKPTLRWWFDQPLKEQRMTTVIETETTDQVVRLPPRDHRRSTCRSPKARHSASSVRTAPARRPRSGPCSTISGPTSGRAARVRHRHDGRSGGHPRRDSATCPVSSSCTTS